MKKFLRMVLLLPAYALFGGIPSEGSNGGSDDTNNNDDNNNNGGNEDTNGDSGNQSGDNGNKNEKTFTQAEVNRMMANEKKQGMNSVLKKLGFKDVNAASEFVSKYKSQDDSSKTDEQRKAEADERVSEAENRATIAEAKAEAMILGAKPEFVDDVITLAMSRITDEKDDFKEIIGSIKTRYPNLFAGDADENNKAGQKGTGGNPGKGAKGKGNEDSLGSRLANARRQNIVKSSYFGKGK